MKPCEQQRFDSLYQQHLTNLKLQGKRPSTIDSYSRAVRRIAAYFDCCPDNLSTADLKQYFADLIESHSCLETISVAAQEHNLFASVTEFLKTASTYSELSDSRHLFQMTSS